MKDYNGGGAQAEVILTKQLNTFFSLSVGLFFSVVWDQLCTWVLLWHTCLKETNEALCENILVSWWVIISKHFSVWLLPELISHLFWFIAAVRTVYCPCGWIEAVRRRKGQCWAKHQRYSQNALCLPHTRTLFHLSINTPSCVQSQLEDGC